jgi:hypothetical protein
MGAPSINRRGDEKPWWVDVAHNHGYGLKRFDSYLRHHLPDVPGGQTTLVASSREFDPLIRLHASLVQRQNTAMVRRQRKFDSYMRLRWRMNQSGAGFAC